MNLVARALCCGLTLAACGRCADKKPPPKPRPTPAATPLEPDARPPAKDPAHGSARPATPDRDAAAVTPARSKPRPVPNHAAAAEMSRPPTQARPILRHGRQIDIDVHRMDVRQLLSQLAVAAGTNIVLTDEVRGTVTVRLRNLDARTAVEVVARAVGCGAEQSGRMVVIRCTK